MLCLQGKPPYVKANRKDRIYKIMTRREAREAVFGLVFETEFHNRENYCEIYELACEDRDIADDEYIRSTYFGICEHIEDIDKIIGKHSNGWRANRLAFVSRSIIRLAVYELLYVKEIPANVSINEAVELAKKYDDEKARAFINGVLNSVYKSLSSGKDGKAEENAVSENE